MFKIKKIKIKEVKVWLGKIPRIMTEKAFLSFLALLFFGFLLNAFIFYKCNTSRGDIQLEEEEALLQFEQSTGQSILDELSRRENKIKEADSKVYIDPF